MVVVVVIAVCVPHLSVQPNPNPNAHTPRMPHLSVVKVKVSSQIVDQWRVCVRVRVSCAVCVCGCPCARARVCMRVRVLVDSVNLALARRHESHQWKRDNPPNAARHSWSPWPAGREGKKGLWR